MVRVPVLSEQITEVQPSVSTEGRLRTIAFRFAILRVPETDKVITTCLVPDQIQKFDLQKKFILLVISKFTFKQPT